MKVIFQKYYDFIRRMMIQNENISICTHIPNQHEQDLIKLRLEAHLRWKNDLYFHSFHRLFYEKYNHALIRREVYQHINDYHLYHQNLIITRKVPFSQEINRKQAMLALIFDQLLYEHHKKPESLICDNVYQSKKSSTFYVESDPTLYCKRVEYERVYDTKTKKYKVDFGIFDKIMEIYIQNTLYDAIVDMPIRIYHPIPRIRQFYLYTNYDLITNMLYQKVEKLNVDGHIYIEMDRVGTITLDKYISSGGFKNLVGLCELYIQIAELLEVFQSRFDFIHGDLKGSNIILDPEKNEIYFIDFEFSYMKMEQNGQTYHLYSQENFLFDENYDPFELKKNHVIEFVRLYTSKYRFSSDLLYLLLCTLGKNDPILQEFFVIQNINLFTRLIQYKEPYEAFVYSKDLDLLAIICNHYSISFESFIIQFEPSHFIQKMKKIIQSL